MEIITYASKYPFFSHAKVLLDTAVQYGGFTYAQLYTPEHIDSEFMFTNNKILSMSRGGGYWLWKPYIIDKHMKSLPYGAVFCYCDSRYKFVGNFTNTVNAWLKDSNIAITQNKPGDGTYPENVLTKGDVYKAFGFDVVPEDTKPQAWAGFIAIRKDKDSEKFIRDWIALCTNEQLITDSVSVARNHHTFIENRHDQSLLSLLYRCTCKYNVLEHINRNNSTSQQRQICVCDKDFKHTSNVNFQGTR
jgi:hypothetical protein